jgi:branched-chain amino acid transport system ATP-binding protein
LEEVSLMSDKLLQIKNLDVNYKQIIALSNIDLHIDKGEIVSLIGANGAGKTTLLRSISALKEIKNGQMLYDGVDITNYSTDQRVRLGIAQVPEGRGLFSILSVEDNLLMGAYTRSDSAIKEDLHKIYDIFPILKEKRKQFAGTLSGGQQQMLAVGRALMLNPKLLLLDEPSMGLAPIIVEEIFEVVGKLRDLGCTVFVVEQNAFLALSISDRCYVLENGKIAMSGNSQDVRKDPKVKEAYLGA